MDVVEISRQIEDALTGAPIYDVHTHLVGGGLGARGLHDILLYHALVSELYAAGCPDGARLTPYPDTPSDVEVENRIRRAIPFLDRIRNTSNVWMLRQILSDLYGWDQPITVDNWRRLHSIIIERSSDPGWPYTVLDRLHIDRSVTEYVKRNSGVDDDRLLYAVEWGMVTRAQWDDEYDTPLYELERCWAMPEAGGPMDIGGRRLPLARRIRSAEDAHEATEHFVSAIPAMAIAMATHLSTDLEYRVVSPAEFDEALGRRGRAGSRERDVYASFLNEQLLMQLSARRPDVVFQFSFGAEPLPYETGVRLRAATLGQLGQMVARYPALRFQCNNAARGANQSLCSLARELPNLSLAGYWWHSFYPDGIEEVIGERLDMLPVTSQCGFFSDAYCVEWAYGKARMVRRQMAIALAHRVRRGQYGLDDALSIAHSILYETPEHVLRMSPRPSSGEHAPIA